MARPLRIEFPGAFYHVTSRGNERKAVFKTKRDREQFFEYLESATQRYDAVIHVKWLKSRSNTTGPVINFMLAMQPPQNGFIVISSLAISAKRRLQRKTDTNSLYRYLPIDDMTTR